MHVLIVLDHPDPNSFSAAAAARFGDGARRAGHTTELADLHAEGFDPRWTMADVKGDLSAAEMSGIRAEHERIERADAVCLVFPLYWWGMPSMMKGWIDRVWCWDWAYDQLDDHEISLQRPRSGVLLIPAGARSDTFENDGYLKAMETTWMQGTFGYFGFSPRRIELLYGATGSEKRRKALLEEAYQTGLTLPPPSQPRDGQAE